MDFFIGPSMLRQTVPIPDPAVLGGQNINKVNTTVTLRLRLEDLDGLSAGERGRLGETLASRITGKQVALFCCCAGGKGKVFDKLKGSLQENPFVGKIAFMNPAKQAPGELVGLKGFPVKRILIPKRVPSTRNTPAVQMIRMASILPVICLMSRLGPWTLGLSFYGVAISMNRGLTRYLTSSFSS